jgi:kynurenine 3-monooxygenase
VTEVVEVVIAGAGLSGALAAIYLARRGHGVRVVDRRTDPRLSTSDGRSINLGLSQRGIQALREVGLLDELWPRTTPMRGRMVHTPDGALSFHPYGTEDHQILHSVLRDDLNAALIDRAESYPGVRFDFTQKVVGLDKTLPSVTVADPAGETHELKADLVIGADGAFSAVRNHLLRGERAEFHQEFMDWGYKEITIPAHQDTRLEALHLWPGKTGLVVAHPNHDGTLTATMFLPFDGPGSFAELTTQDSVAAHCAAEFSDLPDLVPDLVDQFLSHPVGTLVTIRTSPWQHDGKVVLVGDAAHAVYPFYGQGMNAAFEDCSVLDTCLAAGDLAAGLREFERRRRRHTDVLAELSKQNFLELRDGMRSPLFLARKKADLVLHRMFPRSWTPLYTMIAHTTTPYGDALARARRQDRALAAVAALSTVAAGIAITARMAARSRRQVP